MNQKYNFYKLKGSKLPGDVNAPVHKVLIEQLKCPEASEYLRELESGKTCGEIQIFFKVKPKYIRIKTNYGMVEGYDLVSDRATEGYQISVIKHIKNTQLSMSKPKKTRSSV